MLLFEAIFIRFYCYNIFLMNKPQLIHPTSGGHWVLWTLWILWIVVLWTFVYISWGTNFCWLYCQGVELQGHKVCMCSFSKMVIPVYSPTSSIFSNTCYCLLNFSRSNSFVALYCSKIYISMMTNEVEYLFYISAFGVSSFITVSLLKKIESFIFSWLICNSYFMLLPILMIPFSILWLSFTLSSWCHLMTISIYQSFSLCLAFSTVFSLPRGHEDDLYFLEALLFYLLYFIPACNWNFIVCGMCLACFLADLVFLFC